MISVTQGGAVGLNVIQKKAMNDVLWLNIQSSFAGISVVSNEWISLVKITQPTGFEPVRAEPNGFQVHRLNHSATTADVIYS